MKRFIIINLFDNAPYQTDDETKAEQFIPCEDYIVIDTLKSVQLTDAGEYEVEEI